VSLLIKNAQIVNATGIAHGDILIEGGTIVKITKNIKARDADKIFDAQNKHVLPGLIDMHTHLRSPGREDEETIESGSHAAAKGGVTTLLCMPNTELPLDTQQRVSWVRETALSIGVADVYPVGCITKERKGKELTEFGHLKEAGAIALSDDGSPVENSLVLRRAMEFASAYNLLIISHCEDLSLATGGILREGKTSSILGLQGIPAIAESIIVAREIELARYLNTRIHLAHISCKRSVDLIRRAKRDGVKVTSETCPHYFSLTVEAWEERYNALLKVNPPLPEKEDIAAIKKALDEGTIDVIASDHAPHTKEEKSADLSEAPFGMIGLELLFPLSYTFLVEKGKFSLRELVKLLCAHPAQVLGFTDRGSIKEGKRADLTVVDPQASFVVRENEIASLSKNTPFLGTELKGKVLATIFGGKIVYNSFK